MKLFLLFILVFTSFQSFSQFDQENYKAATAYREKKSLDKALKEIDKAILSDSLNTLYLNEKAAILWELNHYQEAFDLLTKSVSIDPGNITTYIARGIIFYSTQNFDEAIDEYSYALTLAKGDTVRKVILVNRAAAYIYKRNFDLAYEDLIAVYRKDSNDIATLTNLAVVCDEIGKGDETLKYLERVIRIDPENDGAYVNMGFKYQDMGEYKKAIQYYNKALELNPDEPLGYSNRSYSKLQIGDIRGAHADIEKSLKLYPENSYAYKVRALIHLKENKKDKACSDLSKAIELNFTAMYGDEVKILIEKHCSR